MPSGQWPSRKALQYWRLESKPKRYSRLRKASKAKVYWGVGWDVSDFVRTGPRGEAEARSLVAAMEKIDQSASGAYDMFNKSNQRNSLPSYERDLDQFD